MTHVAAESQQYVRSYMDLIVMTRNGSYLCLRK